MAVPQAFFPMETSTASLQQAFPVRAIRIEDDGCSLISGTLGHQDGCGMVCGTGSSLFVRIEGSPCAILAERAT